MEKEKLKKDLLQLEKDALLKWIEASKELKAANDYVDGEDITDVLNPLTGMHHVDEDFLRLAKSWWALYGKCVLAQQRYFEIAMANDELIQ